MATAITKEELLGIISEAPGHINVRTGDGMEIFNDGTAYPPAVLRPTVVGIKPESVARVIGPYLKGQIEIYSNYRPELGGTYYVPEL